MKRCANASYDAQFLLTYARITLCISLEKSIMKLYGKTFPYHARSINDTCRKKQKIIPILRHVSHEPMRTRMSGRFEGGDHYGRC